MTFYLVKLAGVLVVPPGINFALFALGLGLGLRWRRLGVSIMALAVLSLLVVSLPIVATLLSQQLDRYPPLAEPFAQHQAQAIVVLGGGRRVKPAEYGEDTVLWTSLMRCRYAAHLQRLTGLPILVSGGRAYGEALSEAELMQRVLVDEFGATEVWVEGDSKNTAENARFSENLLLERQVSRVLLVTNYYHMQRSLFAFAATGLEVIPAPMGFPDTGHSGWSIMQFVPQAWAVAASSRLIHEIIGLWWYQLRY